MKNLIIIFLVAIPLLIICTTDKSSLDTQVIITIPNLSIEDLSYLHNEFKKYTKIDFIEGSIEGKTIELNVNSESFDQQKIVNMLNKWDCRAADFDYSNLIDVADVE